MSFVGDVVDSITGRSAKKAASQQTAALEESQRITREGVEQARRELKPLFEDATRNLLAGLGGSAALQQQIAPQQMGLLQGGNVAAQQSLISGLPQIQNALLGGQIDYSQLQPYRADIPTQQFDVQSILSGMSQPQTQVKPPANQQGLSGWLSGPQTGVPPHVMGGTPNWRLR